MLSNTVIPDDLDQYSFCRLIAIKREGIGEKLETNAETHERSFAVRERGHLGIVWKNM